MRLGKRQTNFLLIITNGCQDRQPFFCGKKHGFWGNEANFLCYKMVICSINGIFPHLGDDRFAGMKKM